MDHDLSPKTVFALVLLTVIVSFIGTLVTVSQVLEQPGSVPKAAEPSTTAYVGFTIEEPDPEPIAVGMISLTIEE